MRLVAVHATAAFLTVGMFAAAPHMAAPRAAEVPPGLLTGWMAEFSASDTGGRVLDVRFVDAAGAECGLGAFHGRVVVLNFFATWCAPCRDEMPSLDRIAERLAGDVAVVGIATDPEGPELYLPFLAELDIDAIAVLGDPRLVAYKALEVPGLPATLVLDRQGREVGRLGGPAEWDSPEAEALLRHLIGG